MGEFELIETYFKASFCAMATNAMALGIGDDCALLNLNQNNQLAISTDTLVGGSHFPIDADPFLVGQRVLATTVSDLAAMGATPIAFTLALTLPEVNESWLRGFAEGLADKAKQCQISLAGGDTTKGPLTITATVLGEIPKGNALCRKGAQVGDLLCVSGYIGLGAGALPFVLDKLDYSPILLKEYWSPLPQLELGLLLRGKATACIDISDGLVADCGHIANASGVALMIDSELLPYHPELSKYYDKKQCLSFMLTGGDDYQLAFTLPEKEWAQISAQYPSAQIIGSVQAGAGVTVLDENKQPIILAQQGHQHFRS